MDKQLKEIIEYFTNRLTNLFLTEEEFCQLYDLASNVPENGRIIEIGAGAGCSMVTMGIASKSNEKKISLISIDPFNYEKYREYGGNISKENALAQFTDNMKFWGLDVKLLRECSALACKKIEDKSIDLLFIDGNHQYSQVKADIINYSPKMKDGGILCGHDYRKGICDGVVKAVDEIFNKNFQVLGNSSIWRRE